MRANGAVKGQGRVETRWQSWSGTVDLKRWEVTAALTVVLFLIMIIPERLVAQPLGPAGRPGVLLAIGCLLWWFNVTLIRGVGITSRAAVARVAITPFLLCVLISYVVANVRPIDALEGRAADRGLLNVCAWAGVWLLTSEGIGRRADLEVLLRRMVTLGSVMAGIGVVQYLTGFDASSLIVIPGLSSSGLEAATRNGLNRPASTTAHPIEFGVVMAMLIPLALHQLNTATGRRGWARLRLFLIATAVLMSMSRSAILGIAVAGLMLVPTLPRRQRRQLYLALPLFAVSLKLLAPGLISTLIGLFSGISSDSSTASRTNSYSAVAPYIREWPIFGRGFGTFLPSYRILDNQLLGALIEIGAVGLVALVVLLLTGPIRAWRTAKRQKAGSRSFSLGIALSCSAVVAALSFATFDALGFSVVATLTFFMGGCCCAYSCLPASELLDDEDAVAQPGQGDADIPRSTAEEPAHQR